MEHTRIAQTSQSVFQPCQGSSRPHCPPGSADTVASGVVARTFVAFHHPAKSEISPRQSAQSVLLPLRASPTASIVSLHSDVKTLLRPAWRPPATRTSWSPWIEAKPAAPTGESSPFALFITGWWASDNSASNEHVQDLRFPLTVAPPGRPSTPRPRLTACGRNTVAVSAGVHGSLMCARAPGLVAQPPPAVSCDFPAEGGWATLESATIFRPHPD
jgi:hypothetical protein